MDKELKTNPFLDIENPRPMGPGSYEMALPLVNSTKIKKGMRILEVGTGTGQVAATLAKHWNVSVITLEPSGKLGQSRTHADQLGVGNQVLPLKIKAQSMPFSKDAFDAVISINSFEMIGEDRQQALSEMIRVARPGARIGIAGPMCLLDNIPYDFQEDLREIVENYKKCSRTLNWNCELFQQYGLKITEKYYFADAYEWWLNYRDQKGISPDEQNFIAQDQGRWLSLGIVVGEKVGMTNDVIIRSEEINDYNSIASLNALTFTYSYGMGEVPLISVLRNRPSFDPHLSLVAEYNGKIVGHVFFTPQQVRVKGHLINAVILAPLVVHPDFQKQGIGSKLVEEGHKRALEKGFDFSLLVGHSNYYPRFGYLTKMWGTSYIDVQFDQIPDVKQSITERRIEDRDVEELCIMWDRWYSDSSLALVPGTSMLDWISYDRGIRASVVTIDGELSGYICYEVDNPKRIVRFLAKDQGAYVSLCSYFKSKIDRNGSDHLSLPIDPNLQRVKQLVNLPYNPKLKVGESNMIKILSNNGFINGYCNEVKSGLCSPGSVFWPVEFDIL